jgi:putative endopeptidase
MKRILASFLVVVLLISAAPLAASAASAYITRGQVADMLLSAADGYNSGVQLSDIIKGYADGGLKEDQPVSRVEAYVMLSRAFGTLPTPVGDNARSGYSALNFTDIPDWAKSELSNLWSTGIAAGTSATTFSPDSNVTENQMELLIQRVYALEGTNQKDDFYAAVNKSALDSSTLQPGYPGTSAFIDTAFQVNSQVAGIINDIAGGDTKTESEKKIEILYNNVMDKTARNSAGITPLKAYLEAIDSAKTIGDMMDVHTKIVKGLGTNMLLGFGLTTDAKDSTKYILSFGTFSPLLGQSGYESATETQKATYLQFIETLFTLSGMDADDAANEAGLIWNAEKEIASKSLDNQEASDVGNTYNLYTMAQLKETFPNADIDALFSLTGMTNTDKIQVSDVGQMKAVAALFDQTHVDTLKALLRINLLNSYGACFSDEFTQTINAFKEAYYGTSGSASDVDFASAVVESLLPNCLGEAYVSRYFSAAAKTDVNNMVSEIVSVYKKRIQALTWMSDTTKTKAVEKLDAMVFKIGYPDKWDTDLDGITLKSAAEGGSFFDNMVAISQATRAEYPAFQKQSVDKTQWQCTPYTVNAYYDQQSNSIVLPAAILQAPFYDVKASKENNLGGIGYVIAHEITHAFDNNGAKYDKNGNAANWWTDADYSAFQQLCGEVVSYYNGREAAPGIACNGALTVSEDIADLGSVACITQVAGTLQNPDYKTLYSSMAKIWYSSYTRQYRALLSQQDVHAPDKLRVNLTLATQDQFYKTFDIEQGDGMYIAPADRVTIW